MRARAVSVTTLSVLVLTVALINPGCSKPVPATLRMGVFYGEQSAAIAVAEEEGYFAGNGLDVTLTQYESGARAVEFLLAGREDVVTATDYVFAGTAFRHPELRMLGIITNFDATYFVTDKASGITSTRDLEGRSVGTVLGTSAEYFLGASLRREGMTMEDVEVVDMAPADLEGALLSGAVDAVVTWEPVAYEVSSALGDSAVVWSAQGVLHSRWTLITTVDALERNPARFDSLMRSMVESTAYVNGHEVESKRIVAERFGLSARYLDYAWPKDIFDVAITSCLLLVLDAQGLWYQESGRAGDLPMPDYRELIALEPLESADPDAIKITR